jgi:hypothetical protein
MENLVKEVFSHAPDISELVNQGRYDLVVDDTIILPQCWTDLIEPGWTVEIQLWPVKTISDAGWSDTSSSFHPDQFYAKVHRRNKQTWRYIRKGKVMRATRNYLWRRKCRRMLNQQWSAPSYSVPTFDTTGSEYQSSDDQAYDDQSSEAKSFESQSFEAQIEFPYTIEEASDESSPPTPIFNRGPHVVELTESDTENAIMHGSETILAPTTTVSAEELLNNEQVREIRSIESIQDHDAEDLTTSCNMPGPSRQLGAAEDNFPSPNLAAEAQNLTELKLESEHGTVSQNLTVETLVPDTAEVTNDAHWPSDKGAPKDSGWPKEDQESVKQMPSTDPQFHTPNINGTTEFAAVEKTAEPKPLKKQENDMDEELTMEQGPTATSSMMTKLPTPNLFSGEAMLDEPSQALRLNLRKVTMDTRFYLDIATSGLLLELTITAVQELALISTDNFWWERYKVYYRAIQASEVDSDWAGWGTSRRVGDARSSKPRLGRRPAPRQARKRPVLRTAQKSFENTARSRTFDDPEWAFTLPQRKPNSVKSNRSNASSRAQTWGFMSDITEDIYDVSDAGPSHQNVPIKGKERSRSFSTAVPVKPRPAYVKDEDEDNITIITVEDPSPSDSGTKSSRSTRSTRSSSSGSSSDSITSTKARKPSRSTKSSGSTRSSGSARSSRSTRSLPEGAYSRGKGKAVQYSSENSMTSTDFERIRTTRRGKGSKSVHRTRQSARIQQSSRKPSVQPYSRNQILPYGTDYSLISNPFSPAPRYPLSSQSYSSFAPHQNYFSGSPSYNAYTQYPQVSNSGRQLAGTSAIPKPTIEDKKNLYYTPSTDKPRPQDANSQTAPVLIPPKGKVGITLEPITIPTAQGAESKTHTSKLPSSMKQPPLSSKNTSIPSVPPIFMWPVWKEPKTSGSDSNGPPTNEASVNTTNSPTNAKEYTEGDYELLMRVLQDAKSALDVYLENYEPQKLLLSKCRPSTRQEVEEKLKSAKGHFPDIMEDRKELVKIAISLLDAFVHKFTRSELVDVFYGALLKILQPPVSTNPVQQRGY